MAVSTKVLSPGKPKSFDFPCLSQYRHNITGTWCYEYRVQLGWVYLDLRCSTATVTAHQLRGDSLIPSQPNHPSYVLHKDLVALNTVSMSNKIRFIILLLRGKDVLAWCSVFKYPPRTLSGYLSLKIKRIFSYTIKSRLDLGRWRRF